MVKNRSLCVSNLPPPSPAPLRNWRKERGLGGGERGRQEKGGGWRERVEDELNLVKVFVRR